MLFITLTNVIFQRFVFYLYFACHEFYLRCSNVFFVYTIHVLDIILIRKASNQHPFLTHSMQSLTTVCVNG